jgi:hypothetical protein
MWNPGASSGTAVRRSVEEQCTASDRKAIFSLVDAVIVRGLEQSVNNVMGAYYFTVYKGSG